jgi:tetratricopeptide (TPR) repeat protein
MENGDIEEAKQLLLEDNPQRHSHEFAHFLLGYCYYQLKDYLNAVKFFGRAKNIRKKPLRFWSN